MRTVRGHVWPPVYRWMAAAALVCLLGGLAMAALAPGQAHAAAWYDTDWSHRKKITINSANVSGGGSLSNFPVLVSITDADLAADALDSGHDILFTAGDEVTKIPHEIESYNGTSGELRAWVNVPSVSATTDTDVYLYYANSGAADSSNQTGTWNTDFTMVQHLAEASGPSINGSTSNAVNGTAFNTPAFGASGAIDGAVSFTKASDEHIRLVPSNQILNTDDFTVEAWFNTTTNHPVYGVGTMEGRIVNLHRQATASSALSLFVEQDQIGLLYYTGSTHVWVNHTVDYHDGADHHIAVTHSVADSNTWRLYFDGVEVAQSTDTFGDFGTFDAFIAAHEASTGTRYFDGTIDEVRAAATPLSADWLQTTYNTVTYPADFLTTGPEENAPGATSFVGGRVLTVNKLAVLAPWLGLGLVFSLISVSVIVRVRRRRSRHRPPDRDV